MTILRPSFAEREAFRSALSQAYAEGRIDDAEFAVRSEDIESGISLPDLDRALRDLPKPDIVVPATVLKSDVEKLHRTQRAAGGARWGRRVVLGVAAVVLGFVIAGGPGAIVDSASVDLPAAPGEPVYAAHNLLSEPQQLRKLLATATEAGYTDFTEVTVHPELLTMSARSPQNSRGLDSLTLRLGEDLESDPSGQFPDNGATFPIAEADPAVIMEMARVAPTLLSGRETTHLIVSAIPVDPDDPEAVETHVRVYVDGDEYGAGSGSVEWTADGAQLVSVYRSEG